jgi:putative transcriptional regulator
MMREIQKSFNPDEHIARLKSGCFLFSTEILSDPNFNSTIVLICQHSKDGSYGLVLNRPAHMPLTEIFNAVENGRNRLKKVYIGGPVQGSELQILHITKEPVKDAIEISQGVYLGGYWDDLDKIISDDSQNIRLFLGYSGWGKNQLENEIKLGGWEVFHAGVHEILTQPQDPWMDDIEKFKKAFFK